jgi:hypothetical protein
VQFAPGDLVERRHGYGTARFGRIVGPIRQGYDTWYVKADAGLTYADYGCDLEPFCVALSNVSAPAGSREPASVRDVNFEPVDLVERRRTPRLHYDPWIVGLCVLNAAILLAFVLVILTA